MINFFRKIRQKLFVENRFSKYLLYAIGEIVLVMIGILLALQVNNWNEAKKEHQLETEILNNILLNMESDLISLDSCIAENKKQIIGSVKVLEQLNNDLPLTDSLRYYYARLSVEARFSPNTVGYDNLRSMGINIIRNEHLKKEISELYGHNYFKVVDQIRINSDIVRRRLINEMNDNLNLMIPAVKVEPINSNELRHNFQFINAVRNEKLFLEWSNKWYNIGKEEIELVARSIRNELEK